MIKIGCPRNSVGIFYFQTPVGIGVKFREIPRNSEKEFTEFRRTPRNSAVFYVQKSEFLCFSSVVHEQVLQHLHVYVLYVH